MTDNANATGRGRLVILDALRGIAGLCVPLLHLSEAFGVPRGTAPAVQQVCGHGYLAVEFFLLLMGYMFGYAYDRRWREGMGYGEFFKRRLIRLHPCVIAGLAIGFTFYLTQVFGAPVWFSWLKDVEVSRAGWLALLGSLMLPAFGSVLLAPFNACSWTLYYEYFGNIFYATIMRRFGRGVLFFCTTLAALLSVVLVMRIDLNSLLGLQVPLFDEIARRAQCTLAGGWSLTPIHCFTGFVRLLLPMFLGLLLFRLGLKIRLSGRWAPLVVIGAFLIVLFMPYSYGKGSGLPLWVNGIYELLSVTVFLPIILLSGIGINMPSSGRLARISAFFAELSYPLYMTHYPFIAVHQWWVRTYSPDMSAFACVALSAVEFVMYLAVAFGAMKLCDRISAGLIRRP